MANGSIQYILAEEELFCPICFEEYEQFNVLRHPKLLLCLHTFCYECIQTLRQHHGHLQCSICRTDHNVKDLSELLDNYIVFEYLERKQLLEDEQLANQLNEENSAFNGEEEASQDAEISPDFIDDSAGDYVGDQYPICEQDLLNLPHDEYCSDEEAVPEVIEVLSDNEENAQSHHSFSDAVEASAGDPSCLAVDSSSNVDQNAYADCSRDDEGEASYSGPAESLSLSEHDTNDGSVHSEDEEELEVSQAGELYGENIEESFVVNDSEHKSNEERSDNETYAVEVNDYNKSSGLSDVEDADDWETEEESDTYTSYEQLNMKSRKIKQNDN